MNTNGPDSQWAKLIEEGERKHKLAGWLDQVTSQLKSLKLAVAATI